MGEVVNARDRIAQGIADAVAGAGGPQRHADSYLVETDGVLVILRALLTDPVIIEAAAKGIITRWDGSNSPSKAASDALTAAAAAIYDNRVEYEDEP